MEAPPNKVFDRELGSIVIRKLFEKDEEGGYVALDTTEDRETCEKKYRIPGHQRYNKWTLEAKENTIDSIWRNYIIGSLSLSRQSDGNLGWFLDIEDGQSRLTVIQEYLDDKFEYRGAKFSDRTKLEQDRFLDYEFSTDVTQPSRIRPTTGLDPGTTEDHRFENFDRINKGKALEDNDKYWALKHKPMVARAIELIEECKEDYPFMKTDKFNTKDTNGKVIRKPLDQFVTMIDALINDAYKNTYLRHYENMCEPWTPAHKERLNQFMIFYKSIYDGMIDLFPARPREKFHFNNPGKFLGMIIMHFQQSEQDPEMSLDEKRVMWVNILNIDRRSDNFMKGTVTLWSAQGGFTAGDQKNQEKKNILKRLDRVKEFYNNKRETARVHHIEFIEPVA